VVVVVAAAVVVEGEVDCEQLTIAHDELAQQRVSLNHHNAELCNWG